LHESRNAERAEDAERREAICLGDASMKRQRQRMTIPPVAPRELHSAALTFLCGPLRCLRPPR
jgi:hypothetical protein